MVIAALLVGALFATDGGGPPHRVAAQPPPSPPPSRPIAPIPGRIVLPPKGEGGFVGDDPTSPGVPVPPAAPAA